MTSLYEAIGADPKASEAEIKAAYRKAAKKAHPDAGGSPEEFNRVGYAGMILCDPQRRAHYDRTGAEHGPVNEIERRIGSILSQAFEQDEKDPIRSMCEFIDRSRSQVRQDKARFDQQAKKLGIKRKKFLQANAASKNTESRDFIAGILEYQIAGLKRMSAAAEAELEICSACLAYLNDLKCPPDVAGGPRRSPLGFGATVIWNMGSS